MRFLLVAALAGCVIPPSATNTTLEEQATGGPEAAAAVEPTPGGTLSCGEVFRQCDVNCVTPDCIQQCETRGTPQAQRVHHAVVVCAKASGCFDQACVEERCDDEIAACEADGEPDAGPAPEASPTVD
jgi:hypothetical protein